MAGRKSLYTPEMQAEIVKLLTGGATVRDTCMYVGITEETFFAWVKRYPEFSVSTMKARVSARVGAAMIIRKAALDGDLSAATWYLERTDPEHWGRRTYAKIEGLDELLKLASAKGVAASDLFAAMIAELSETKVE